MRRWKKRARRTRRQKLRRERRLERELHEEQVAALAFDGFKVTGTATGRFASAMPNLQNMARAVRQIGLGTKEFEESLSRIEKTFMQAFPEAAKWAEVMKSRSLR